MTKKLIPQDVHLLAMKWADPDHLPLDESIGPQEWKSQYRRHLEHSIAEWLAKGLVAYQYPKRRIDAFVPISHLIGTSRDSISYVDSLIDIAEQLEDVKDPRYQPHPITASRETDFVLLGECFAKSIANAAELILRKLIEDDSQKEKYFQALVDVLTLIQAVRPPNAGSSLYAIWTVLQKKDSKQFEEMSAAHPWLVEHALVLACYSISSIPASREVRLVLRGIETSLRGRSAPVLLKNDLKACKKEISIGELVPIQQSKHPHVLGLQSIVPSVPVHILAQYRYDRIASRYPYGSIGGNDDR